MRKFANSAVIVLSAFCCAVLAVLGINYSIITEINNINQRNNSIRYLDSQGKFKSNDILASAMDQYTIPVMGSSELNYYSNYSTHPKTLLNYSNLRLLTIGEGGYLPLSHAITLGSIADELPRKTINLIVSQQWWQDDIPYNYFPSTTSYEHIYRFLCNPRISDQTKKIALTRIDALAKNEKKFQQDLRIVSKCVDGNVIDKSIAAITNWQTEIALNYEFWSGLKTQDTISSPVFEGRFNWKEIRKKAVQDGRIDTSSNPYSINNKTWAEGWLTDKKILDKFRQRHFTSKGITEDLDIFLRTAKDLGIHVNLFLIPLPEKWYKHVGLPKSRITEFRKIFYREVNKYEDVTVFDYQKYAGIPYFFADTAHLGHVGWTYLLPDLLQANGFGRFNGAR